MNPAMRAEAKSWSVIALLVILLGLAAFFLLQPAQEQWLEPTADGVRVSVPAATQHRSYYDGFTQQYDDGFIGTAFSHEGYFAGTPFRGSYSVAGKTALRFTPDLIPGDGIPDVFMLAIHQNSTLLIRAIVDQDYKDAFGSVNFVWGAAFQHQRVFSYRPASKGIYTDEVPDDPARRVDGDNNIYGGVALGKISTADFQKENPDVTAIILT